MHLTLVVPCYNEAEKVGLFLNRIQEVFSDDPVQIVFVDDGSTDNTLSELKRIFETNDWIKVISFSRNFGKEAAILAGLRAADGDLVCVIDADLQQDPAVAEEMIRLLNEEPTLDVVAAYQDGRREGLIQRLFKFCFYKIANRLCDIDYRFNASDFRVMRRKVVEAILSLPEKDRFSKGIFSWVGFKTGYVPYTVKKRLYGKSKWHFSSLLHYAVSGIFSYTQKPLRFTLYLSFLCLISSVLALIFDAVFHASLALSVLLPVILFLFSALFFVLWIFGEYLGKALLESKDRPAYIIREEFSRDK